jgi:predicted TIM-barrel fold metal-dependent hydrolase
MLAEGQAWTKISGADRLSGTGTPYEDVDPLAKAVIAANIERIVWGADWPHIAYFDKPVPDDGDLLNLLARWLPDAAARRKVLVDNPATLYGWPR